MRIGLIDDEPIVRETISGFLADLGHEVTCADSEDELISQMKETPVDVVITDLRLTGSNGNKFIRRIRCLFSGTPIVIISGHRTAVLSLSSEIESEVYAALPKPFSLGELEHLLLRLSANLRDRTPQVKMDASESAGGSQ